MRGRSEHGAAEPGGCGSAGGGEDGGGGASSARSRPGGVPSLAKLLVVLVVATSFCQTAEGLGFASSDVKRTGHLALTISWRSGGASYERYAVRISYLSGASNVTYELDDATSPVVLNATTSRTFLVPTDDTNSSNSTNSSDSSDSSGDAFSGLVRDSVYSVTVLGYTLDGDTTAGNSSTVAGVSAWEQAEAPANVTLSLDGPRAFLVSFEPSTDLGYDVAGDLMEEVESWVVELSRSSNFLTGVEWNYTMTSGADLLVSNASTQVQFSITGPGVVGSEYFARVFAVTDFKGLTSEASVAGALWVQFPSPPNNVTVGTGESQVLSLRWNASVYGNTDITYVVESSYFPDFVVILQTTAGLTQASLELPSSFCPKTFIRVRAVTSLGESGYSQVASGIPSNCTNITCPAATYYLPLTFNCSDCPTGRNSDAGAGSVNGCGCEVGSYAATVDAACTPCPANSTTVAFGAVVIEACVCEASLYLNASRCSPCQTYPFPAGCPARQFWRDCDPFIPAGCIECQQDYSSFPNSSGADACVCDVGRETNNCTLCPLHTYKDTIGYGACTACLANAQTAEQGGDNFTDCSCNAGYHGPDGTLCEACWVGAYKGVVGADNCTLCREGMTTFSTAAVSCTCGPGYTAPSSSWVEGAGPPCDKCATGTYKTAVGSAACLTCPWRATSPEGSAAMESCYCPQSDWLNTTGEGMCTTCEAYIWMRESVRLSREEATATPIPEAGDGSNGTNGTNATNGSNSTEACNGTNATSGTNCSDGSGEVWVAPEFPGGCEAGQFWQVCARLIPSGCNACPANSWSLPGRNTSASCKCLAGHTGPDGGPCLPCAIGTYKDQIGNATCTSCPAFSTSDPGAEDVFACKCVAGYTGADGGPCGKCEVDTYKGERGDAACTTCQAHSQSVEASVEIADCDCSVGYYRNNSHDCLRCPSNGISDVGAMNVSNCRCDAGFSFDADTEWCTPCGNGTFKALTGSGGAEFCLPCTSVDPLSVAPNNGSSECHCRPGMFQQANGQCAFCASGKAKATVGDEACTFCVRGTHQPLAGQRTCRKCPANTYNRKVGSRGSQCLACRRCPAFSVSAIASPFKSNCTCLEGYTGRDGLPCTECAAGTYKNETGAADCGVCTDTDPNLWSGIASRGCACNAGYQAPDGDETQQCQACIAGNFKGDVGFHACEVCVGGTYSSSGSSACVDCPTDSSSAPGAPAISSCGCLPGYSGQPGVSECLNCLAGSFKPEPGTDACEECPAGTYQPNNASAFCFDCPTNASAPAGSVNGSACQCAAGYEQLEDEDGNGTSSCEACQDGFYKSDLGSAGCSACEDPRVGGACPNGTWWRECTTIATSDCVACNPNSWGDAGSESEVGCKCNAGYSGDDGGECTACERGTYKALTGDSECVECGEGRLTHPASTHISDCFCPLGYIEVSREANAAPICACDHGYELDTSNDECVACAPGTYKNTQGSSACLECASGFFSNRTHATSCHLCTPIKRCATGQFWKVCPGDMDGKCGQCTLGNLPDNAVFSGAGFPFETDTCPWVCDEGYVLENNVCVACDPGEYRSPLTGECVACKYPATSIVPGAISCTACATGYYFGSYSPLGHAICRKCESKHTTTLGPSARSEFSNACRCDKGYFGYSWLCKKCPAGGFKDFVSPISDVEYFRAGRDPRDDCVQCPKGSFGAMPGQTVAGICTLCPEHSISSPDGSSCLCVAGYFDSDTTAGATCSPCPLDTFNPTTGAASLARCTSCPDARHSAPEHSANQTACVCDPGYFGNDTACSPCLEGSYNPYKGQSFCANCSFGAISLQAADNVSGCFCNEQYYGDGLLCTLCPVFSSAPRRSTNISNCTCISGYAGDPNADGCEDCPDNMYTWVSTLRCSCNAGFYETGELSGSCTTCPVNSVSENGGTGVGACKCNAGYYGDLDNVSACSICPENSDSPFDSATEGFCTCNAGYAGDPVNSRACTLCTASDANSYPWVSSLNCTCNTGYYAAYANGSNGTLTFGCDACGVDSYNPSNSKVGPQACLSCPARSGTLMVNATTSLAGCHCDAGYYKSVTSVSTSCTPCPTDTYNEVTSVLSVSGCLSCPVNSVTLADAQANVSGCVCIAGFYGSTASSCARCPNGTHNPAIGAALLASCLACPDDAFSRADSEQCVCAPGHYGDPPGAVDCAKCPRDYYQPLAAMTALSACLACPAAAAAVNGSAQCTCIADHYGNPALGVACTPCPNASSAFEGSTLLTDCTCNLGYFGRFPSDDNCTFCPGNATTAGPDTANVSGCGCVPGYFGDPKRNVTCQTCPANSSTVLGATLVDHCFCVNGTIGDPGEGQECARCPAFSSSLPGSNNYSQCFCIPTYFGEIMEGNFTDENSTEEGASYNGSCTACPANAETPRGSTDLEDCQCAPGWYGSPVGNVSCRACPGMATSPLGSEDLSDCRCISGFYGAPGRSVTCVACVSNSASEQGSEYSGNCSCNPGYYGDPGASSTATTCQACPANSYNALSDQVTVSACVNCTARAISEAASPGVTSCVCPQGAYGDPGSGGSCTLCPANTYNSLTSLTVVSACVACPANAVTLLTGSTGKTDCICDRGYFAQWTAGVLTCYSCPVGTYSSTQGITAEAQCVQCPANASAPTASDALEDCACVAGLRTNATTRECRECPRGTFSAAANPEETCTACLSNSYSSWGATSCTCDPGYYGYANASSPCLACPSSFYNPTRGAVSSAACVSCPTFSGSDAASVDLYQCACTPGYYGLPPSGIACTACPTNTSQPLANVTNSSWCVSCGGGAATPSGSADCAA